MDLSIIIPVYNVSEYLEFGFKEILPLYDTLQENQFEIIYINDGSTDYSLNILYKIQKKKKNIQIINQENQGLSGARNAGIIKAKGEFLCFLDADDYLDIKAFLKVLSIATSQSLDLTGFRLCRINSENIIIGNDIKQKVTYNKVQSGKTFTIEGYSPNSACLFIYKTKFLIKNNLFFIKNLLHEDEEFMTRVMFYAKSVIFKDIIAYYYLQREGSIMKPKEISKLEKLLSDEIRVAELIKQNITHTDDIDLQNAIIKNYNSVVWNLLWSFYKNTNELSYAFKLKCIKELKTKNLYPIRGGLKTNFQKLTRIIMNNYFIFTKIIRNRK